MKHALLLLVGLAAGALPAAALEPGPQRQVGRVSQAEQTEPAVAPLKRGGYVVTWYSAGTSIEAEVGAFAQVFNDQGLPSTPRIRVADRDVDGVNFAIAALADGGFAIAWVRWVYFHSVLKRTIFARRFTASGKPASDVIKVSREYVSGSTYPHKLDMHAAGLAVGGFVISWIDKDVRVGATLKKVVGRRYDARAVPVGTEVVLGPAVWATGLTGLMSHSLAPLSRGGFAATWVAFVPGRFTIKTRQFNDAAVPQQAPVTVGWFAAPLAGTWVETFTAGLADGGFIAAHRRWTRTSKAVEAQRFDGAGSRAGNRIDFDASYADGAFAMTGLSGGGFVVSHRIREWYPVNFRTVAQRYDDAGNQTGAEFRIDVPDRREIGVRRLYLAPLRNNGMVAVWCQWDEDRYPREVWARTFHD